MHVYKENLIRKMGFFFLLLSFYELNIISSLNTQQSIADRPFQRAVVLYIHFYNVHLRLAE